MAGVTSLPELATGVSAVAWLGQPNLAAGAVMGSCLFNLALIAMMDLAYQPGRILAKAHDGHILSGGLGIEQDVVIAGSEGVQASRYTEPPLTTLDLPTHDLAWPCMHMLMAIIYGEK